MHDSQTYANIIFLWLPAVAYLLGSIPWGVVLTRIFTSIDIRRQGSGNIGLFAKGDPRGSIVRVSGQEALI